MSKRSIIIVSIIAVVLFVAYQIRSLRKAFRPHQTSDNDKAFDPTKFGYVTNMKILPHCGCAEGLDPCPNERCAKPSPAPPRTDEVKPAAKNTYVPDSHVDTTTLAPKTKPVQRVAHPVPSGHKSIAAAKDALEYIKKEAAKKHSHRPLDKRFDSALEIVFGRAWHDWKIEIQTGKPPRRLEILRLPSYVHTYYKHLLGGKKPTELVTTADYSTPLHTAAKEAVWLKIISPNETLLGSRIA